MTLLKPGQPPIFFVNIAALAIFTFLFLSRKNYEFMLYIFVIIFFLGLILASNRAIDYPHGVLWGLTLWAVMHMSGGGLYIGGKKLYELMILPLVGAPYFIFKYDQLVHIIGFWVATLVFYHVLRPQLAEKGKGWVALGIILAMAGLGAGALNEIVEFSATVIVPETGVGGYNNTALDLVADLIGAVGAVIYLSFKESRGKTAGKSQSKHL